MPALPIIAIGASVIGAGAAVVGTINSAKAQNRANEQTQKQYDFTKQINQNAALRERRNAVRAARLTAGSLSQGAENQGAGGTSAALGGQGSIQSQLNTNLSFLDTQTSLATKAGDAGQAARVAEAQAAKWGSVTQLGIAVFNTASKYTK